MASVRTKKGETWNVLAAYWGLSCGRNKWNKAMVVKLKSLRYYQFLNTEHAWTLDGLVLGPTNLLVGKNATGKTRALNVIANLAKAFLPEPRFRSHNAGYDLLFDADGEPLRYELNVKGGKVKLERIHIGSRLVLNRGPTGKARIFIQQQKKNLAIKPPISELAAVVRRDSLQHPFLEPLHEWALAVRHYAFGTFLGQNVGVIPIKGASSQIDERDQNQLVPVFRKGLKDLGRPFVEAVIEDMRELKYFLTDILQINPNSKKEVHQTKSHEFLLLGIKEDGVSGVISQNEISQGMFRVLSLLIQVNYSQMAKRANCILVDDIGEGLDYQRASSLIELLRKKSAASEFQLVMSTNDQFVMNAVPLTEWSILQRSGSRVTVRNYENSKPDFDDFRFVGMSNFSFFETDFLSNPPQIGEHD